MEDGSASFCFRSATEMKRFTVMGILLSAIDLTVNDISSSLDSSVTAAEDEDSAGADCSGGGASFGVSEEDMIGDGYGMLWTW